MADVATANGAAADKAAAARPTKPDENAFKEELSKAEKAHKASMDRLVSTSFFQNHTQSVAGL